MMHKCRVYVFDFFGRKVMAIDGELMPPPLREPITIDQQYLNLRQAMTEMDTRENVPVF